MSDGTVVTTDQLFASRLHDFAVQYGWSGDLIEVARFVDWVHDQLEIPAPTDYED